MNFDDFDVNTADLIFVDCEFTGLELLKHELVEIGYIKAKAGTYEPMLERTILLAPQHIETADPKALEVIGYTSERWASALPPQKALEEFLADAKDCVLVGQNIGVDRMFIQKALEEQGMSPNYYYKSLDTFVLAWQKLAATGQFKKYSLSELATHFAINQGTKHRALDDARATYELFLKLVK